MNKNTNLIKTYLENTFILEISTQKMIIRTFLKNFISKRLCTI